MKPFLEYVANDIIGKFGTDLSSAAVVFPNKRASLFLNTHLAKAAGRPIWAPSYLTISDLFKKHSQLSVADNIKLVCDLYKSFVECTGTDETFDHFYGWGQVLLSDFDDIDKNLADPQKVFANIQNYHELDDVSYLTPEQVEAIQRFFKNFSQDHNTELKKRFLTLWSHFYDIYVSFNDRLRVQGLAYEGSLYRNVAGDGSLQFEFDRYIFVGFNMLHEVERQLFKRLAGEGKAKFYWDIDKYYMPQRNSDGNEAGHYISSYIADFPNELDSTSDEIYDNFTKGKHITYVASATDNIQARYVGEWLQGQGRIADGRKTAIVLCDEGLLKAVVHSFPDNLEKVNVTTGYPLAQSPFSSLLANLINLQVMGYSKSQDRFRLRYVNAVLRHPYMRLVSPRYGELLQALNGEAKVYHPERSQLSADGGTAILFCNLDSDFPGATYAGQLSAWIMKVLECIANNSGAEPDPFFRESLFRTYTIMGRISGLIAAGDLAIDHITLQRLIRQVVQSTSVPFHGEPAEGLQVMGILETRNLDFDHLLVLSCNEGNMPKGEGDTSFIPYSIRKAFGLTTVDNKVAIYSYYFYRLLQRATDVTIMYNNSVGNRGTGEMSRFMLQMMVESGLDVARESLRAGLHPAFSEPQPVAKSEAVVRKLRARFGKADGNDTDGKPLLTPSAINKYMRCQLQFFYNYVCDIKEAHDDDEMDNRTFGNVFHAAAQAIYENALGSGGTITRQAIEALLEDGSAIGRIVDDTFKKEVFKAPADNGQRKPEYNGLQLINREVIVTYLRRLLEIDRRLAPFKILGLESDVCEDFTVGEGPGAFTTTIGGRVDRIDMTATGGKGRIRIVDYKTGGRKPDSLPDIESVFDPSKVKSHSDYYLQAILYSMIASRDRRLGRGGNAVSPALLFIQHAVGDDYDPTLCFGKTPITDVNEACAGFDAMLRDKVNEMFDPALAFTPTDDDDICRTCPYLQVCWG